MPRALIFVCLLLCCGCEPLFFYPNALEYTDPREGGIRLDDIYFKNREGQALHGWFLPAAGSPKGTVLFLHGNAQNITAHVMSVYWLPAEGFNVFLPDYRGYGKSEGKPTLAGLISDAEDSLAWLVRSGRIDNTKIALFGQSLGASIALNVAAKPGNSCCLDAIIIDSGFSTFRGIVRDKLNDIWLSWPLQYPLSFLMHERFNPTDAVKQNALPIVFIHGGKDPIVPAYHSDLLFQAAREPKQIWKVPEAGHIEVLQSSEFRKKLVLFLEQHLSD